MKPTLLCFGIFLFLMVFTSCKHPFGKTEEANIGFTGDSGYISDAELFHRIKFDTVNNKDTLYKIINIHSNDTIGKYYEGSNGHYFSCLNASQGFTGSLLVETTVNGTIIAKELYGAGINGCCWNNDFDGFRKYGDYISFRRVNLVRHNAAALLLYLKPLSHSVKWTK